MNEPLVMEAQDQILTDMSNDETRNYLFMGSPGPVAAITVIYFLVIFWIGPSLMVNRKPFQLKSALLIYNIVQILWALYILIQPFRLPGVLESYMDVCRPPGAPMEFHPNLFYVHWSYFICKIVDLLDTVFCVLRKKQKQITFLHVYHHSGMVISAWMYIKYILDPTFAVLQYLNTAVHLIMYSYYLISSLGPRYSKFIWWKKYMTWIQLAQFVIIIGYTAGMWLFGCEISRMMGVYVVMTVSLLFILFANFYIQTYRKSSKKLF